MLISVVVLTHKWPQALALALAALARQRHAGAWEVIVTEDGTDPATRACVERFARDFPVPLRHLSQPHEGFRAARARNRGIAAANGDYIVLLDGDMVPQRWFLADHANFARKNAFLQGGRVLLDEAATGKLLADAGIDVYPWTRGIDRASKVLRWPWLARIKARPRRDLNTIMSCNQSFWRADLLAVNGFDERMVGWGYEDTELAARLLNHGLMRHSLKFCAIAAHLHHRSRGRLGEHNPGKERLDITLGERRTWCERGIADHLAALAQGQQALAPDHSID